MMREPYDQGGILKFYVMGSAADVEFSCSKCDNVHPDDQLYNGSRSTMPFIGPSSPKCARGYFVNDVWVKINEEDYYHCLQGSAITFHLSDSQAYAVAQARAQIKLDIGAGSNKFVDFIHNCAAQMWETYEGVGFPHHFSLYIEDKDWLNDDHEFNILEVANALFINRFYPVKDYLDPYRQHISLFTSQSFPIS